MQMEEIRARVDEIVDGSATAEALKPWYRQFCKRPCFHDGYLQTFNRPNVTLVDTQGKGVERATEKGVVVDGVEYPLDCLIFATGFEVGTDYSHRSGYGSSGATVSR
jgi:cation diffusion facilitator CzcD-associated flavoprotein CzcO